MIDDVQNHLHGGGDNRAATRRPGYQHGNTIFENNGGGHRAEHALARLNGIGLTTNHTIVVGSIFFGGEVIHLVVQQEPCPADHDLAAVGQVKRGGI